MSEAQFNKLIYLCALISLLVFAGYHLHLHLPIPEWLIGSISTALGILVLKNGVNSLAKRINGRKSKGS